jgi:pyruvate formate lyase activating enzyme
MSRGLISNFQRFSLHDGPGIRTTVFLKGCPLNCSWCHNPENRARPPELVTVSPRCIRCGQCAAVCPQGQGAADACSKEGQPILVNHATASAEPPQSNGAQPAVDCLRCGACVEACPAAARQLLGSWYEVEDFLREIMADRMFFEESGGGITFSGGEPLLQIEFLTQALAALRARELSTAIDTCGYAPRASLERVAPMTSVFLYDLKFVSDADHLRFTGVSNALILDNLRWLASAHDCIWLRCPIIPGVNDHEMELEAMAAFAAQLPAVRHVNLLPYHRAGIPKFQQVGRSYPLPNVQPPTPERTTEIAAIFRSHGLRVRIGG